MSWFKNTFNNLARSTESALSLGNIIKRVFLFFMFGIILGLQTLVWGLDKAGANKSGFIGFVSAMGAAVRDGLGTAHATLWDVIRNVWFELTGNASAGYIANSALGTIIVTSIFFLAVMGFWFQPISLLINIFDFKGKKDTGDKSGQATSWLLRAFVTFIFIFILSCIIFYADWSTNIAGGGPTYNNETINDTNINMTNNNTNNSVNITSNQTINDNYLNLLWNGG